VRVSTTIDAPREEVMRLLLAFDLHPRMSPAFKDRHLLLTMANELHPKGQVEWKGRRLVEDGRYTPYPPHRIAVEETFPSFGLAKGDILLEDLGGRTRVTVDFEFHVFGRHLRRWKSFRGKPWARSYFSGALLGPLKAALENPEILRAGAEGVPGVQAKEASRGTLFDKEAEARAREELLKREGKPPSAGVSPSGDTKKK
jgi:uncharacterized protein YndB with AHSA1/START domain